MFIFWQFTFFVFASAYGKTSQNDLTLQISENLQNFLTDTLQGCTIRLITRKGSSHSGVVFQYLNSRSSKTYITQSYTKCNEPIMYSTQFGNLVNYEDYESPDWLFKKHTTCYSHLYVVEDAADLQQVIRCEFVKFDLKRENPRYVIMWDLSKSHRNYRTLFKRQEFYRTFMDYRLLIRTNRFTSIHDVSLVCIVCPWHFPERLINPLSPATDGNIKRNWKALHSNHFRYRELSCFGCETPEDYNLLKERYRKDSIHWVISLLTNITISYTDMGWMYDSLGTMTSRVYLTPIIARDYILEARSPTCIMSPAFAMSDAYKMFTVARKSLFINATLTDLFAALSGMAWLALGLSTVIVSILVYMVTNKLRWSSIYLSVYGPLTDHWTDYGTNNSKTILFLWGTLCFSLTVLYGGEMASSLAVLKPPRYPETFDELYDLRTQIISLGGSRNVDGSYQSMLAESISQLITRDADQPETHATRTIKKSERRAKLINEINHGFCDNGMEIFNRSNEKAPFVCTDKPYAPSFEKPVTFVDYGRMQLMERHVFQETRYFWVSSTTTFPDLRETFALFVSRNYFAKLVLPIASASVAAGLDIVWKKVHDLTIAVKQFSKSPIRFDLDRDSESTRVVEFSALRIRTHTALVTLFLMLLSVSLLAFLGEWGSSLRIVVICPNNITKKKLDGEGKAPQHYRKNVKRKLQMTKQRPTTV